MTKTAHQAIVDQFQLNSGFFDDVGLHLNKPKCVKHWRPVGPYPSIEAASRATDIHPSTLGGRLRSGWDDYEALYTPVGPRHYVSPEKLHIYRTAWINKSIEAKINRNLGLSYRSIARKLHCSASKAYNLVNRKKPAYS